MSSRDESDDLIGAIFYLVIGMPVLALMSAFTVSVLWDWFVVTTFGMASLTLPQAYGLGLLSSILTYQINVKKNDESIDFVSSFFHILTWHGMVLLMGKITTMFM